MLSGKVIIPEGLARVPSRPGAATVKTAAAKAEPAPRSRAPVEPPEAPAPLVSRSALSAPPASAFAPPPDPTPDLEELDAPSEPPPPAPATRPGAPRQRATRTSARVSTMPPPTDGDAAATAEPVAAVPAKAVPVASRIKGGAVIALALTVLWWNEGRAAGRAAAIATALKDIKSIETGKVDAGNEGKLVHISGTITGDKLTDPFFSVAVDGLALTRTVEVYQWQEKAPDTAATNNKNKKGPPPKTTYTKVWSEKLIDWSKFKEQKGHENPSYLTIHSETWKPAKLSVGAFVFPTSRHAELVKFDPIKLTRWHLKVVGYKLGSSTKILEDGTFYAGPGNMKTPMVGDMKITMKYMSPLDASLIGKQTGDSFEPYPTADGGTLWLFDKSKRTADLMLSGAASSNTMGTWVLRGVGVFMILVGVAIATGNIKQSSK